MSRAPTPIPTPKFDYSPPSGGTPGSAGAVLAIVTPAYSQQEAWTNGPPFADFAKNMAADFDELLAARGFSVKGPFRSYEEMVYPDKQGSDLILVANLDLSVAVSDVRRAKLEILSGQTQAKGTAVLGGRVNLSLSESLTNTRMWSKSIPIASTSVAWEGERWWPKDAEYNLNGIFSDPGFVRAVAPALEKLYVEILGTAWNYLEPREVAIVKEQSQEPRRRAVTSVRP